jgi:IS5 family transposase
LAGDDESEGEGMIVPRYRQRTIYEAMYRAVIPDHKELLWEQWMERIDSVLDDDELIEIVHEALGRRHRHSRTCGRHSTPSEVVLRLMVLKHMKNWSYATLEREVRPNLLYREFTRIGGEKVPDEKTLVRLGQALGPEVIRKIHDRVVVLAREERVVSGRKMRLDTTVVESNIHYPTDSSLLGDGIRVLTHTMERVQKEVGQAGTKVRNWMRSTAHRLLEVGSAVRGQGAEMKTRQKEAYRKLIAVTRRVLRQAAVVVDEVRRGVKKPAVRKRQRVVTILAERLEQISALTKRVIEQTKARVIRGDVHFREKLLSIFEVDAEPIRKGKAAKPTEFGKMVKIQEAENQIITDYEVFTRRPADQQALLPAIEKHKLVFGRAPVLVAGDAGFFSAKNEARAKESGVKKVAIPNKGTRSALRRAHQRQRWFRRAQHWRVGCEGRISVLKRRHGLFRSRYRGHAGMQRWVGLGVIADNLISIARATTVQ